mgnify:CR=1 FL=1
MFVDWSASYSRRATFWGRRNCFYEASRGSLCSTPGDFKLRKALSSEADRCASRAETLCHGNDATVCLRISASSLFSETLGSRGGSFVPRRLKKGRRPCSARLRPRKSRRKFYPLWEQRIFPSCCTRRRPGSLEGLRGVRRRCFHLMRNLQSRRRRPATCLFALQAANRIAHASAHFGRCRLGCAHRMGDGPRRGPPASGSMPRFPFRTTRDYNDLLHYVEAVRPNRVLTLHGFRSGIRARSSRARHRGLGFNRSKSTRVLHIHARPDRSPPGSPMHRWRTRISIAFCHVCEAVRESTGKLDKIRVIRG